MNDFVQLNTFCNLNCSFFSLRRAHTQANLAIDVDDDVDGDGVIVIEIPGRSRAGVERTRGEWAWSAT